MLIVARISDCGCALWRGDVIVKATTMLGMEHLFASIAGLQEIGSSEHLMARVLRFEAVRRLREQGGLHSELHDILELSSVGRPILRQRASAGSWQVNVALSTSGGSCVFHVAQVLFVDDQERNITGAADICLTFKTRPRHDMP